MHCNVHGREAPASHQAQPDSPGGTHKHPTLGAGRFALLPFLSFFPFSSFFLFFPFFLQFGRKTSHWHCVSRPAIGASGARGHWRTTGRIQTPIHHIASTTRWAPRGESPKRKSANRQIAGNRRPPPAPRDEPHRGKQTLLLAVATLAMWVRVCVAPAQRRGRQRDGGG